MDRGRTMDQRRIIGFLALSSLVLLGTAVPLLGEDVPPGEVATAQDAAACLPELTGLKSMVAGITDSRWVLDEKLRFGWLLFDSKGYRYTVEGVDDSVLERARETMIASDTELRRLLDLATFRVEKIPDGFTARFLRQAGKYSVTATREDVTPDARRGLLVGISLEFDTLNTLARAEYRFHDAGLITLSGFEYAPCEGRYRLAGVTLHRSDGDRTEHLAIHWVRPGGIWLPRRVERVARRESGKSEFLCEWRIHYRSVNGEVVEPPPVPAFSTPDSTVRALFDAARDGDRAMLAKCFSKMAPREFQPIVRGELTAKQLTDLRTLFSGARLHWVKRERNPDRAVVHVILRRGNRETKEQIELVRAGGEWRVLDFGPGTAGPASRGPAGRIPEIRARHGRSNSGKSSPAR